MNLENLPRNLILFTYDIKEVKSYAQAFFTEKEERLQKLIGRISSDLNVDKSELDFSEDSLVIIDRWLVNHVECVKLNKEEYDALRKSFRPEIDVPDWKLSSDTFSNVISLGMYLGETMIHKYPDLKWEQFLKRKRDVDYGHVTIKLEKLEMNPIWLVNVVCIKIARQKEDSIHKLFRIWEKHVNL